MRLVTVQLDGNSPSVVINYEVRTTLPVGGLDRDLRCEHKISLF